MTEPLDIAPAEEPDVPAVTTEAAPEPPVAPGTPPLAIETFELTKRFGRHTLAVDAVDLAVEPGQLFGLVGPDGAGKSTLIRMLATVLRPTAGDANIFGESVRHHPAAIKPRVGYMSQRFSLYPDLTVAENLRFFAELRGVPRDQMRSRADRLLEFSDLTRFSTRQAQYLSGGMKQKLALAVTLMHEPDLLFLDEPTTGVDPVSRREFWRIIADLHARGITVFVATPYMDEAERCDRIAFMDGGRILLEDTPPGLKARVPGRLVEIESASERAALDAVRDLPGVHSALVHGDLVRALVADDGPDPAALADAVSSAGIAGASARFGRVDMEAAFAYLAEEARASASIAEEPAAASDSWSESEADL